MKTYDILEIKKYSLKLFTEEEYSLDAISYFDKVFDKIIDNNFCKEHLQEVLKKYDTTSEINFRKLFLSLFNLSSKFSRHINEHIYTCNFIILISFLPYLEEKYLASGYSKEMFNDTALDFKWKMNECYAVYGIYGTFVPCWYQHFFDLKRLSFKRLQFEPLYTILPIHIEDTTIPAFSKYYTIHIPSSGPLTEERVLESINAAYDFISKRDNSNTIIFGTHSWLLSKNNLKLLPESSNINKFAKLFHYVCSEPSKIQNDFWRIYNRPYNKRKPDYSGNTTLQQQYAEHLKNGGNIGSGFGIFIYDGDNIKK